MQITHRGSFCMGKVEEGGKKEKKKKTGIEVFVTVSEFVLINQHCHGIRGAAS